MKVANIERRDIYITLDFSLEEIKMIHNILNHSSIEYDGEEEPEMKEAVTFLNEQLAPLLKQLSEEVSQV